MKVKFDDDIPNIWKVLEIHKIPWFQTTNQVFPIAEKALKNRISTCGDGSKPHINPAGHIQIAGMQIDSHPSQIWTFKMWLPSDVCCFSHLMKCGYSVVLRCYKHPETS